jgi:hypothetical protein
MFSRLSGFYLAIGTDEKTLPETGSVADSFTITQDIKISHLFKRLTLSAGRHFVNSFPPCPARRINPQSDEGRFFRAESIPCREKGESHMKLKIALT